MNTPSASLPERIKHKTVTEDSGTGVYSFYGPPVLKLFGQQITCDISSSQENYSTYHTDAVV